MSTFKRFEDIEAWKTVRELTRAIYNVTKQERFSKDFGLVNQLRRASDSIMANIAEGFERGGKGEFQQFLSVAKGSNGELKSHLYIALDQSYINQQEFNQIYERAEKTGGQIGSLMNYLRKSEIKGNKYKS